jgi:hypothetical protein
MSPASSRAAGRRHLRESSVAGGVLPRRCGDDRAVASHLPGMSIVPAVGIGIGAMCAAMLKLPFTSVLLATVLLTSDGYAVMPVVIVAVVVSYVTSQWLPAISPFPAAQSEIKPPSSALDEAPVPVSPVQ